MVIVWLMTPAIVTIGSAHAVLPSTPSPNLGGLNDIGFLG